MTKSEFRMTLKIGEMKVPMVLILSIIAHADYAAAPTSRTDVSPKRRWNARSKAWRKHVTRRSFNFDPAMKLYPL